MGPGWLGCSSHRYPRSLEYRRRGCLSRSGNVQVDVDHLGTPRDVALHAEYTGKEGNEALVDNWSQYAKSCQQHGTPTIVQICHPGRQSLRFAGRRGLLAPPIAPSAIPLQMGDSLVQRLLSWLVFPPPREMTQGDIDRVTRQFVDAARLMADSGFSGIELHGAHGYLIGMLPCSVIRPR